MGRLGEVLCQLGGVAELVERRLDRLAARQPPRSQLLQTFFEMIAQLVGDLAALRRFEPQKAAQKREVKFKVLLGHWRPLR